MSIGRKLLLAAAGTFTWCLVLFLLFGPKAPSSTRSIAAKTAELEPTKSLHIAAAGEAKPDDTPHEDDPEKLLLKHMCLLFDPDTPLIILWADGPSAATAIKLAMRKHMQQAIAVAQQHAACMVPSKTTAFLLERRGTVAMVQVVGGEHDGCTGMIPAYEIQGQPLPMFPQGPLAGGR